MAALDKDAVAEADDVDDAEDDGDVVSGDVDDDWVDDGALVGEAVTETKHKIKKVMNVKVGKEDLKPMREKKGVLFHSLSLFHSFSDEYP